jgi:hypothetical protein
MIAIPILFGLAVVAATAAFAARNYLFPASDPAFNF